MSSVGNVVAFVVTMIGGATLLAVSALLAAAIIREIQAQSRWRRRHDRRPW